MAAKSTEFNLVGRSHHACVECMVGMSNATDFGWFDLHKAPPPRVPK